MTKECVCKLVHKVASLSIRMVTIVVYDRALQATWYCHSRKRVPLRAGKVTNFIAKAAERNNFDFKIVTNSEGVQRVRCGQAQRLAYFYGDPVSSSLEPPHHSAINLSIEALNTSS